MKHLVLIACISFCFAKKQNAQTNLILNPSFEDLSLCPDDGRQIDRANNWFKINSTLLCQVTLLSTCCTNTPLCSVPFCNLGGGNQYQWPRTGNSFVTAEIFSHPPPLI